jgi:prepilin-type N-terminal cleavage/methylation domain-containing protein
MNSTSNPSRFSGFTLVELLVVIALLGVFLGMMANSVNQTGKYTANVVNRSEQLDDMRVAGQMIADQVNKALYIYPPGSSITFSATPVASTVTNNGSPTWVVGRDPIIAYIEPPVKPAADGVCSTGTPATPATQDQEDACIFFVAYIAVKRSYLTDTAAERETYGAEDTRNPDVSMIFEYRKRLPYSRLGDEKADAAALALAGSKIVLPSAIIASTTLLTGTSANLVADYVESVKTSAPGVTPAVFTVDGFKVRATACRRSDGLLMRSDGIPIAPNNDENAIVGDVGNIGCQPTVSAANAKSLYASVAQGSLELRSARKIADGSTVSTPLLTFPIFPQNLYKQGQAISYN